MTTQQPKVHIANSNTPTASSVIARSEWLTTIQVGCLLQISHSSLEKARSTGAGPFAGLHYHKIGRSVRYRRSDIQTFLDSVKIAGSRLQKLGG